MSNLLISLEREVEMNLTNYKNKKVRMSLILVIT